MKLKRLLFLPLALGTLFLVGCDREISFSPNAAGTGTTITPTPANVTVGQARKDRVVFKNKDDRVHRIDVVAGTGAAGAGTLIYPPNSGAGRPDTYIWTIPAATTPPATFTWRCLTHPGESGTITVNP